MGLPTSPGAFLLTRLLGSLGLVVFAHAASAQLSLQTQGTPVTINFDTTVPGVYNAGPSNNVGYNGTAPVSNPGAGQLNSSAFTFQGNPAYQGTAVFGPPSLNGNADGVYGFNTASTFGTGYALGFAAANGSAGTTIGSFSLITANNTGSTLSQFTLAFAFDFYNAANRGVTLNVSYTIGATTTQIPSLTYSPSLSTTLSSAFLSATVNTAAVANGGQIRFNFTVATNGSGAGNGRDEVAFDNISVSGSVPEPSTYVAGALALGCVGFMLRRRGRAFSPPNKVLRA